MRCKVVYRIDHQRPGRLTRASTGILFVDDTGIRIEGPVPYRAEFSEVQWLNITNRIGLFYIGIGSSPPVFVTPMLCSLFGFIRVISPQRNERVYAELRRRVAGLGRCADCGCHVRQSAEPCPRCAAGESRAGRTRGRLGFLVNCALALLLFLYVRVYYHLSRRGYAEGDQYHMHGFYYFLPEDSDAWRLKNYGCVYLFWPINVVDRWLGLGRHPASEPLWRLRRTAAEA